MSNWILALPRAHIEHCISLGVFGLRQNLLERLSVVDRLILMATKEARIIGFGKVTRAYYTDNSRIFLADDNIYPHRIGFSAEALGHKREIDLRAHIETLSFIKSKQHWGTHFLRGLCQIPSADYDQLARSAFKGNPESSC